MNTFRNTSRHQAGFSMIEVLVALIILLVGLLGLAALMIQGQRSEMESYQRVQALILLQDMAGRINANRANAANYVASDVGTGDARPAFDVCPTLGSIAARDLCEWSNALKGASEKHDELAVGTLAKGRGCITYDAATRVAVVSVAWQGLGDTAAPPASLTCGSDLDYGGSTKRRVVSLPVRIGCLNC